MNLNNTQKILLAFITLLLGAVLVGVIATESIAVTAKTNVADESNNLAASCVVGEEINESNSACNITVTNVPTNWKIEDCPLTNVVVGNSTLDFTLDTDYEVFASTGIIRMLNTTDTASGFANTTLVDYTYCADDYLNLSWGRIVINLVGGFFAIALLLISVGLFFDVAKESNII